MLFSNFQLIQILRLQVMKLALYAEVDHIQYSISKYHKQ